MKRSRPHSALIRSACALGFSLPMLPLGAQTAAEAEVPADIAPEGPWDNLNPGAGGRIQDIVLDPSDPGRAYYMSDMEGHYRTDDFGESWDYVGGDLRFSNTLTAAVDPGDSERVYTGHVGGIDYSDDGGATWNYARDVKDPIHQIVIDPADPAHVFAAPGNHVRWENGGEAYTETGPIGELGIWTTADRGATWRWQVIDPAEGRRDVFSIALADGGGKTLYAGTMRGIYHSADQGATWDRVASPAKSGNCWGAAVSPDGTRLFGVFQVSGQPITESTVSAENTKLFVTDTGKTNWRDISTGQPGFVNSVPGRDPLNYWRPDVDPRSDDTEQRILIAPWGWRFGLWMVTVKWTGDTPTAKWENVLNYDYFGKELAKPGFDSGWEHYLPRSLAYTFTPETWGDRAVWTTGDQTLFSSDTTKQDWEDDWSPLYTQFIREIDGERFYRTRGLQCTFVFDGDAYKNYNVQANGDNAVKESFDGGYSWHVGLMKPRSNSVAIVRDLKVPIVLAHISPGYGGSSSEGSLYAKRLTNFSPKDQWIEIAGGPDRLAGLPNRLYEQITPDPYQPGRVFIGTQGDGIYSIPDIDALYDAAAAKRPLPAVDRITLRAQSPYPAIVNDKGQGLIPDPDKPDVLWVASMNKIFRCNDTKQSRKDKYGNAASTWDFEVVKETEDERTYIDIWKYGNERLLACSINPANTHGTVELSADEGKTWNPVVNFKRDIQPLRQPKWYNGQRLQVMGLAGYGNKIYLAYSATYEKRGYGFFEGTIKSPTEVEWRDITGNMIFPLPVKGRVIVNEGVPAYYVGTWGNGWWRYNLAESTK